MDRIELEDYDLHSIGQDTEPPSLLSKSFRCSTAVVFFFFFSAAANGNERVSPLERRYYNLISLQL